MQQILKIILDIVMKLLTPVLEKVKKKAKPVIPPIRDERYKDEDGKYVAVKITAAYPKYTDLSLHKGIDISAKKGQAVYAICDGVISKTRHGAKGKPVASYVVLDNGFEYVVARHCLPAVAFGDEIKAGDVLGHIDASGSWDGYHYHPEFQDLQGRHKEPMECLNRLQPGLKYTLIQGKYSGGRTVRDIFEKYNPAGLAIIDENQYTGE